MADCKINYSPTNYLTQESVTVWNGQSSEQYRGNITWSFATTGAPIPDGGTYTADKFQWLHSSYEKTITMGTAVLGIDDRAIDYNNVQYKFSLTAGTYKLIFEAIDPSGTWYSDRLARYPSSSGYYGTPQYALHSSSGAVLSTINFDRTKYQGQTFVHEEHEFTLTTDRTIGLYFRGMGHADSTINGFMPRFMIVPTDTKTKKFDVTSNNVNYSGYSCWSGFYHSLRELKSATETIQSGDTIYTNGQPITTYSIKGNEEHTGTPSPSNPVMPNGVGERTDNLFDINGTYSLKSASVTIADNSINATLSGSGTDRIYYTQTYTAGTYKISFDVLHCEGRLYSDKEFTGSTYNSYYGGYYRAITGTQTITFAEDFTLGFAFAGASGNNAVISNIMFQLSTSTADFEPYGFKIPILTAQGSAVNYLGSVQSTRQIQKLVLKGDDSETWSMSDSTFGKRFSMTVTGARQSDTSQVATYCTHLPLGVAGATYSQTDTYTITAASVLYMSRDSTFTSVADFKAWLADQYSNGTPVTVWYVLQTATTGIVNEPLMAIGTYADTLSNATAIPTAEGANSITVDTTVQPSEFTATWTGWHDSSVKEYDGANWQ